MRQQRLEALCHQRIEVEGLRRLGAPAAYREHLWRTGALSEDIVSSPAEVRCSVPSEDSGVASAEDRSTCGGHRTPEDDGRAVGMHS